jgi:hypothetical protein
MASARYFQGAAGAEDWKARQVDVDALHRHGELEKRVEI